MSEIKEKINKLIEKYREELKEKIDTRMVEMQKDDKSHYFIYNVLGIKEGEGLLIDEYQNKGRFFFISMLVVF